MTIGQCYKFYKLLGGDENKVLEGINIKEEEKKDELSEKIDKEGPLNILKKRNKRNKESNNNNQGMPTYVDEDSIYLRNIFEEKNNKLRSSRSEGNLFGQLSRQYNRNLKVNFSNNKLKNQFKTSNQ